MEILRTCGVWVIAFGVIVILKSMNACRNRAIIIDAIYQHYDDTGDAFPGYRSMESYHHTVWRLWDWGYKHILPKDGYKAIKDYIRN